MALNVKAQCPVKILTNAREKKRMQLAMWLSMTGFIMMITNVTLLQHVTIYLVHMNADVKRVIEVMGIIVR